MNITYITMQFPSATETFAARDIKGLKALGAHVDVLSMRRCSRNQHRLVEEQGIEDVSMQHGGLKAALYGFIFGVCRPYLLMKTLWWLFRMQIRRPVELFKCLLLLPAALNIARRVGVNKPDLVHFFWGHYPSIAGYIISLDQPDIPLTMFLGSYDLERDLMISRWLAKECEYVFTHSYANVERLKSLGCSSEKIQVVYRGLWLDDFPNVSPDEIRGCARRIFSAGRLVKGKGFDEVVRSAATLKKKGIEIQAVIAGDGPDRDRLNHLVQELDLEKVVQFVGFLPVQDIFQHMLRSNIFMLLSNEKGERLPNVVKEAMWCKCVCIVAKSPGIEELVRDGSNGYIVEKGDVDRVCEIVEDVVGGRVNRGELVAQARRDVERKFNAIKCMEKYMNVFRETASG